MNVKQAKALDLVAFLRHLGHEPTSIRGRDVWFRSPFRPDERTPSFKVDAERHIWYDFGLGAGGTIIDFVEHYHRAQDVAAALKVIETVAGGAVIGSAPSSSAAVAAARPKPVIERVGAIACPSLEGYLQDRAIPVDLARLYFQEVHYRVGDARYRALAFQNDSSGFELRGPNWKGSIGTKDISTWVRPGRDDAAVFEGSFDFLATLAHYGVERPGGGVVVLNSVALVDRAREHLQAHGVREVQAYLDHDHAGSTTLARLEATEHYRVRDASSFYNGYKDASEFLEAKRRQDLDRNR